ncbi:X-Pro aminopeptidase [Croceibacterium mercuriale]|uniref:X-Pro aminopeptidase n=1 Tax=Croceibacterium mercuriale TaxID=1572751 RepID=A0A0B2BY58_9SPHN|nr:aminopeptidase P family protein [Croceibacterium mercuriale]KHL24947.1 X-Pro aminopeptidase [Croceibacterium mercuriale]
MPTQTHANRLQALRAEMARQQLAGWIVPIADEHMSEYVGAYAQRLHWLTGFAGSAGSAVVLADDAAVFVDGRYTIQVREQVDGGLFRHMGTPKDDPLRWITATAPAGARIGYDPWLHTAGWAKDAADLLAEAGMELVATPANPLDAVWQDRPAPSPALAVPHDDALAGRSSADKRAELAEALKARKLDAAIVSALDSVAWLLNIRGADVNHTPVALSYVIAHADGTAELFIAPEKVGPDLQRHLGNAVTVRERTAFEGALTDLAGRRVLVDPAFGVAAITQALEAAGATVVTERDPTIIAKAVKHPAEQAGHRAAQARDGAAIVRFLHWLATEVPKGAETELSAAARLLAFRQATGMLVDTSFDTISAAGPHAALPHYRVDEGSNLPIRPGSIFLVDSGGQYRDGTTDITRTVWIPDAAGTQPTPAQRDRFTRVLQGHIALDRQTFPAGTIGGELDVLARQFLWANQADYAHGTGHGVGSFLAVHEGPQRIARLKGGQAGTTEELVAGMILSNEPGYYEAGAYGIRTENLILVVPRDDAGQWLGFETLTFAPIDRTLVEPALLSPEEIAWWNSYHARTRDLLAPQLDGPALAWLEEACTPL